MPEAIPDTLGVIATKQRDQSAAPAFDSGNADVRHNGVCLETQVVHAIKHGRKGTHPNGDHNTLEVDTIAHVRSSFGDIRGTIKNDINRFVKRVPLFMLSTFVEVRLDFVQEITHKFH